MRLRISVRKLESSGKVRSNIHMNPTAGKGALDQLEKQSVSPAAGYAARWTNRTERESLMSSIQAGFAVAAVLVLGCSGGDGAQGTSHTVRTYPTSQSPGSMAITDLDGNGRLDIAVSNSDDDTIQLFLAASNGQLRPHAPSIPAGNDPSDVKAVDVDQDGDSDLVVANHETSHITVLVNDGHADFAAAAGSPYESGARPHQHSVATGDFDGDRWNDIAVESADSREVRLIRGGPTGFREAEGIGVGTMPYFRLGAADVTGDGRVEILVPGHGNNTLLVIAGGREVLADWTTPLPAQPWIVVGDDVSGDGRKDAVVIVTDGVVVLISGPNGFTPASGSPFAVPKAMGVATGDIDGDGIADIAVNPWEGSDVTILFGGSFLRRTLHICERPTGLASSDLDGDRRAELIVACGSPGHLAVVSNLTTEDGVAQPRDAADRPSVGR